MHLGPVFSRAFEDIVVHDAVAGSKNSAARRYGVSWRAVNNMCARLAAEALERTDLLEGLVAVAIDEVKYTKGHKYLTVVCDHVTGKVVWAADGQGDRRAVLRRSRDQDLPAGVRDRGRGDVDHRGRRPAGP